VTLKKIFPAFVFLALFFMAPFASSSKILDVGAAASPSTYRAPDWVMNAVFYQIMVDRFYNGDPSNDPDNNTLLLRSWTNINGVTFPDLYARKMRWTEDVETNVLWPDDYGNLRYAPTLGRDYYGGDFKGIMDKLPYLENLGITAIYFNPIHDGPHFHGYTVENYESANKFYGGLDMFKQMLSALKEKGIRVILDGVFNHTSCTHPWFDRENRFPDYLGAYESQNSPYFSWYKFWQWPLNYEGWNNFSHVPQLQLTEGYKDYLYRSSNSLLKYWNDIGIDGWRLDLAMQIKDRFGWAFWREFSQAFSQLNSEGYLVAEPDHGTAAQPDYVTQGYLDGVMNYAWMHAVIDWVNGTASPSSFAGRLEYIKNAYPADAFYTQLNILSSHDDHRLRTRVGGRIDRVKLAVIFQMTYPGAPCIWYGDEVGMTSDYPRGSGTVRDADPFTRRPFPWPELGYPVSEQPDVPNWDIFRHYQNLISIRKSYQVLRTGTVETLMTDDGKKILALFRKLPNPSLTKYSNWRTEYAVLVYNSGASPQSVTLNLTGKVPNGTELVDVLNGNRKYTVTNGTVSLTVENMWAAILVYTSNQPPVADFTFSPTSPAPGETVQFTDNSRDPDGTIVSWLWDFGDGTSSTQRNPTKVYTASGTYTVKLTVTDDGGASATVSKLVVVSEAPAPPPGVKPTTLTIDPTSFSLASGASRTLMAILKDNENNPVTGKTILWSATAGSISSSSVTDSNGMATATYTAPSVTAQTSVTITATFQGDSQYASSTGQSIGSISPISAQLSLRPIPSTIAGSDIILSGVVEDQAGNPIPGASLKVLINGQVVQTATAGGDGSFSIAVALPPGSSSLRLEAYSGEGELLASFSQNVTTSAEYSPPTGIDSGMIVTYGSILSAIGLAIGVLIGKIRITGKLFSLIFAVFLLLSLVHTVPVNAPTRTVDGSPADWTGTPPTTVNTFTVSAGEFIWKDAQGDERKDLNNWQPDRRVDLLEFRITADTQYIYFMAKMVDIDIESGSGAPCVQVAVDTDRIAGSGENWFGGWSDTATSNSARWERLIMTRFGSGSQRVYVFNTGWVDQATSDDTQAISAQNETIEFRVGWARLGVSPPCTLRFTVITHRQNTDDNSVDISNTSDALDAITTTGPNTWNEVQDQIVDYYFDVSFASNGEVVGSVPVGASIDSDIWWEGVLHDQDNSFYFSPQGETTVLPPLLDRGRRILYDQNVTVKLRTNENDLSEVWLRIWWENIYENNVVENAAVRYRMSKESSDGTYEYWVTTIPAPGRPARMWYRFYLVDNGGTGTYSWDIWQNPVNIGTQVDIDSYADDTFPRNGGTGKMYDFPQTRTESTVQPVDNYDFMIIFYENIPPVAVSLISPENDVLLTSIPTLRWTASVDPQPSSGLGYRLQISKVSDFSTTVVDIYVKENSYQPSIGEGVYFWRVRAEDYDGNASNWSEVRRFRLDLGPPPAPTPISPPDNFCTKENRITLSWTRVPDASEPVLYRVVLSDDAGFPYENFTSGWVMENSWQVELPEGIWYWRVCAKDNLDQIGENSVTKRFIVDITPPQPPEVLYPENGESVNVRRPTLRWSTVTDVSMPVTYDLQLSGSPTFSTLIVDNSGLTENSYTLTIDLEERVYYWRVRAKDNAGNLSDWVVSSFIVDLTALPAPTGLSPTGFINTKRPQFRWSPVQSIFDVVYIFELDDSQDFSSPLVVENALTDTSYQLQFDLSDGKYYWRVRAKTELKTGPAASASFTVDTIPPSAPEILTSLPASTRVRRWMIVGTAEANATVQCFVNDSLVAENVAENGSFTLWVTFQLGQNSVKFRAVDRAGNASVFTSSIGIKVTGGLGIRLTADRLQTGVERAFALVGYQTSIQEIRVKTNKDVAAPAIYVEELMPWENWVEVPLPKRAKVYRVFVVESTVPAGDIAEVKFSFRVELSWLEKNGLSTRDIRLLRYDGDWKEISTSYAGKDATYAYYSAKATGLSWFAITSPPSTPLIEYVTIAVLFCVGAVVGFFLSSKIFKRSGKRQ